jgi:Ni2+-binding GTPase involved in maturation of urease and hydrogenase
LKEALPLIQVIAGIKGSGKTKRIIDMANKASQDSKHDIVFIDDDNRYMFDLRHEVRFINASEYCLANDQMFIGFITGVVAQNFDVGLILIDAFKKLIQQNIEDTEPFFKRLESISEKHNVDFVFSISDAPAELPAFIQKYVI